MPRLTVIMAAKDAAATIRASITSTLNAAPADAEIVVWDDGSYDDTANIADTFGKRVRVFRSEVNRGSGACRRDLVERTDSDFVANMDADDLCLPWRFRLQMLHIKRVDMSFGSALKFRRGWTSARISQPLPVAAPDAHRALTLGNPFPHSSMMSRRSAIESAGNYRDLRRAQDYDLWLRCAMSGATMEKLAVPLFSYRQAPSQISAQEGYAKSVESDPRLRDAYAQLYAKTQNRSLDGAVDPSQIRRDLHRSISQLPCVSRLYYSRLVRLGRLRVPL